MPPENETCPFCGNKTNSLNISENNLKFLKQRFLEKTLDESISLSNIAWNNFPSLRLNADSKAVINGLLKSIQEQITHALVPLEMVSKIIIPLSEKLEGLIEALPEDIQKEFCDISTQLNEKLKIIHEAATVASEPVRKDVKELSETISQLINKPVVKGSANEETLNLSWQEVFVKDKTQRKGGAGQPDLVVVPYFEFNGQLCFPSIDFLFRAISAGVMSERHGLGLTKL